MELKKSEKADLEKRKLIFTEIGLALSLLIVFGAFEYTASQADMSDLGSAGGPKEDIEMVEVTREPEQPKPELEKPPMPEPPQPEEIEETDDKNEDDSDKFKGNEDDANKKIEPPSFDFDPQKEEKETIHIRVEKMPIFPGGNAALLKFLAENLEYPQEAVDMGLEGTVVVKFVVGKDGKAKNPEIVKSVAPMLDKAATSVINKLPLFTPGEQAGEKVLVWYNLPVQFKLAR
ncbi:MAG TPA: energy transducer TonB [Bacteroidales bacterium]|nr:MAG: Gram-negative bacterial tonB protein [Bacteroidetes bacterium ADurb.Bin217]HPM12462.1 energy transducer TonB [Bacteroidales bacterium]